MFGTLNLSRQSLQGFQSLEASSLATIPVLLWLVRVRPWLWYQVGEAWGSSLPRRGLSPQLAFAAPGRQHGWAPPFIGLARNRTHSWIGRLHIPIANGLSWIELQCSGLGP